jgi:cytidine deaminase
MTEEAPIVPTSWDDHDFFTPERINGLVEAARAAAEHAYAPYSNFRVGAVVLTAEGELVVGCNVENASYGLTCCAERTAIFSAVAQGYTDLVAIAISCPDAEPFRSTTRMPCDACRQVMVELLGLLRRSSSMREAGSIQTSYCQRHSPSSW